MCTHSYSPYKQGGTTAEGRRTADFHRNFWPRPDVRLKVEEPYVIYDLQETELILVDWLYDNIYTPMSFACDKA